MSEPVSATGLATVMKVYVLPVLAVFITSLANAIQKSRDNGWKGPIVFSGDIVIALSSGSIFFQFAMIEAPPWAALAGSLGAHLGPKGVQFVWKRFINSTTK